MLSVYFRCLGEKFCGTWLRRLMEVLKFCDCDEGHFEWVALHCFGCSINTWWKISVPFFLSCVWVLVTQSCPALCDPKDCSPPGSSVHGIFQARMLEWVAIFFSRGTSWPRDRTCRIAGWFFTVWATRETIECSKQQQQQKTNVFCIYVTKVHICSYVRESRKFFKPQSHHVFFYFT